MASATRLPTVTFPTVEHHYLLAGTSLYCLVTEVREREQLAHVCHSVEQPEVKTSDLEVTNPMP